MAKKINTPPIAKQPSRSIPYKIQCELWGRAAGRCQFRGCNKLLYRSSVTKERVNIAEKAHIKPYSIGGPRGKGKQDHRDIAIINDIENLMLVCRECHKLIDDDGKTEIYTDELLHEMKNEHEDRINLVSGICPSLQSQIVIYDAKIDSLQVSVNATDVQLALFPTHYPSADRFIKISLNNFLEEDIPFWSIENKHLLIEFERHIKPLIKNNEVNHISLFALAPMPLLILLGSLFTDKVDVQTYQPIREPKGWKWQEFPEGFQFLIREPSCVDYPPALIISISDRIVHDRVTTILGDEVSIWEITVPDEHLHNDNIRNKVQLSMMRSIVRDVMQRIRAKHKKIQSLPIFPAMAISCSVEMGRARMPKIDAPWDIYDHHKKEKKFIKTISIE